MLYGIVMFVATLAPLDCPSGQCSRPLKSVVVKRTVVREVTQVVREKQPVRVRVLKRLRVWR